MSGVIDVIRRCLVECLHLFVDDWIQTTVVVGWIAVACAIPRFFGTVLWSGPLLFVGLAMMFVLRFTLESTRKT